MEYEVEWGDGPLGVTLRPDLGEDMPPVVGRITRQDSAAAVANVAVGHMLVSINNRSTTRLGYDQVVKTLQSVARPAILRFRVPRAGSSSSQLSRNDSMRSSTNSTKFGPSSSSVSETASTASASSRSSRKEQYQIVWVDGPLGMILRPDDEDCHVPCIRKITGKGGGTGIDNARVGDILVAVNGQETKSLGFRGTISLLKSIRKPAVLKFKRMFRRPSRRRANESTMSSRSGDGKKSPGAYDIVWREGDLGLKLKPGPKDVPVLSKLTGKGNASGLQYANIGDELLSVNGSPVEGEAYQDTLRTLKHAPKPAVLRFQPGRSRRKTSTAVSSERTSGRDPERRSRSRPSSGESKSGKERSADKKKRRTRIPLKVAKQLVAASQGLPLEEATFAGIAVADIEDGTKEAHLLRVEAKRTISSQPDTKQEGMNAKEEKARIEAEAKVLEEALQNMKVQAAKYEQKLAGQEKERVLAPALNGKEDTVVNKQNSLIAELSDKISDLRKSYSDLEVIPMSFDVPVDQQDLLDDLKSVGNIDVVVPTTKYCAGCGATEKESKLEKDPSDGHFYCEDCWDDFLNASYQAPETIQEEVPVQEEAPAVEEEAPAVEEPAAAEEEPPIVVEEAPVEAQDAPEVHETPEVETAEEKEEKEEKEAEKKVQELERMRTMAALSSSQKSGSSTTERRRRARLGDEQFLEALRNEEELARAEGRTTLAHKLSAHRERTLQSSPSAVSSSSPTMSDRGSPSPKALALDESKMEVELPSEDDMSKNSEEEPVVSPTSGKDVVSPSSHPKETNSQADEYDDVDEEAEAEDSVEYSDTDEKTLRDLEEKNFMMAKQLDQAHNVIERARMSMLMTGDDEEEDEDDGLSMDQINLFKKLTTQQDERASMVDKLHPADDDSDSDSDGSEEEDDGVWI